MRDSCGRFQGQPDFYADPGSLRRRSSPPHGPCLKTGHCSRADRGAQARQPASRQPQRLGGGGPVASSGELYGERFQTLVLAGQPERSVSGAGGLQDCLGLGPEDCGPTAAIVLFERRCPDRAG